MRIKGLTRATFDYHKSKKWEGNGLLQIIREYKGIEGAPSSHSLLSQIGRNEGMKGAA